MTLDDDKLVNLIEAALLVAGRPMTLNQFENLFNHETEKPDREAIQAALIVLTERYENRGIELVEVASGFRLQARDEYAPWIANLYQEKTPKYSRALIETLVLIAYRQPITRGEIEDVRGVAVSSNIIKTLLERDWVKILGHRDVPGKPALLGTTRQFLDYFNLKRLSDLPTLSEIKDLEQIDPDLAKEMALLESQAEAVSEESVEESAGVESTDEIAPKEQSPDIELPGIESLETAEELDADSADSSNSLPEHDTASDTIESHDSNEDATDEGQLSSMNSNDLVADDADETAMDLTSDGSLHGQIDVHLELEDADSANDETLAPAVDELSADQSQAVSASEADEPVNEERSSDASSEANSDDASEKEETPTLLQVVGESETLH